MCQFLKYWEVLGFCNLYDWQQITPPPNHTHDCAVISEKVKEPPSSSSSSSEPPSVAHAMSLNINDNRLVCPAAAYDTCDRVPVCAVGNPIRKATVVVRTTGVLLLQVHSGMCLCVRLGQKSKHVIVWTPMVHRCHGSRCRRKSFVRF